MTVEIPPMFSKKERDQIADEISKFQRANYSLGQAYLRLRELIPGAFNTPTAPTSEEVWKTTENALKNLLARVEIKEKAQS